MPTIKIKRAIAAAGIAFITAASLAACSSGSGATANSDCTPKDKGIKTIEPGVLTIASYDYAPATIVKGDSSLTGYEGDLLTKFAKQECLTVKVSSAGGASAVIPSIQTARADVGSGGWYRTNKRAKIVRLSYPTALDVPAVMSLKGYTSDDLTSGIKVASPAGDLQNDSMQKLLGDKFSIYQDQESMYSDLAAGRIDAVVQSGMAATGYLQSTPIKGIKIVSVKPVKGIPEFDRPGQIAYPLPLDNKELGDALDKSIKAWHADGTIKSLFEKYKLDPALTEITEVWNL